MTHEVHPLAEIFPLIEGDEFDALVDDIKANGLIDAITLYRDKILDGRNRERACEAAGVIPDYVDFDGDPLAYVISVNLNRRHLNQAQRAIVGARLTQMRDVVGYFTHLTHKEAAERMRLNEREIRSAVQIIEQGAEELVAAAAKGRVDLATATEIIKLEIEPDELSILLLNPRAEIVAQVEKRKKEHKRKATWERIRDEASPTQEWPTGRYSVVYADPPTEDDYGHTKRDVEFHFPTMTWDEVKDLAVNEITTDDAVCYLWATPHTIHKSLEVLAAWGFDYRTHAVWSKDKIGLGAWFRNEHEILLVGRKGNFPPPEEDKRKGSVFEFPVGPHSAKPEEFAELIEWWYPDAVRLELFRRGPPRPGWVAWGLETGMVAA